MSRILLLCRFQNKIPIGLMLQMRTFTKLKHCILEMNRSIQLKFKAPILVKPKS